MGGAVGISIGFQRPRATEGGVRVVDAAVEHGDLDALAVEAARLRGRRTDLRHGLEQVPLVVLHPGDLLDVGVLRQGNEVRGADPRDDAVENHLGLCRNIEFPCMTLAAGDEAGLLGAQVLLAGMALAAARARGRLVRDVLRHRLLTQANEDLFRIRGTAQQRRVDALQRPVIQVRADGLCQPELLDGSGRLAGAQVGA